MYSRYIDMINIHAACNFMGMCTDTQIIRYMWYFFQQSKCLVLAVPHSTWSYYRLAWIISLSMKVVQYCMTEHKTWTVFIKVTLANRLPWVNVKAAKNIIRLIIAQMVFYHDLMIAVIFPIHNTWPYSCINNLYSTDSISFIDFDSVTYCKALKIGVLVYKCAFRKTLMTSGWTILNRKWSVAMWAQLLMPFLPAVLHKGRIDDLVSARVRWRQLQA